MSGAAQEIFVKQMGNYKFYRDIKETRKNIYPFLKKNKGKKAVTIQDIGGKKSIGTKTDYWPGTMAHAYNPNTLGGQDARIAGVQEFETSLGSTVRPYLYKNFFSVSQV